MSPRQTYVLQGYLLPREDESLLGRWDSLLLLNSLLDSIDFVTGLYVNLNFLTGQSLNLDEHGPQLEIRTIENHQFKRKRISLPHTINTWIRGIPIS